MGGAGRESHTSSDAIVDSDEDEIDVLGDDDSNSPDRASPTRTKVSDALTSDYHHQIILAGRRASKHLTTMNYADEHSNHHHRRQFFHHRNGSDNKETFQNQENSQQLIHSQFLAGAMTANHQHQQYNTHNE